MSLKDKLDSIKLEKDTKIVAGNIKKDVEILGVTGTYTSDATATVNDILSGKTAYVNGEKVTGNIEGPVFALYAFGDNTISSQTIGNVNYLRFAGDNINVEAAKFYFDSTNPQKDVEMRIPYTQLVTYLDLTADKIVEGNTILGVTGNVVELNGETKTITPTTSQQTINPSTGKNAITQVTVNAVTSAIDNNITAGNIKKNVTILRSNWQFRRRNRYIRCNSNCF